MPKDVLEIEDFGRALITTGDLDPVYIALLPLSERRDQLARWLVAYWCFYHCGAACWLSEKEGREFWSAMLTAAVNTAEAPPGGRWPRSAERRHFRGKQAVDAVRELMAQWEHEPERMVDWLAGGKDGPARLGEPFAEVHARAMQLRGFGPWISFKVADMLDRCYGVPVRFDDAAVFMFKDPALAVDILWERRVGPIVEPVKTVNGVRVKPLGEAARRKRVIESLANAWRDLLAPPSYDRPINIQEIETCLCKAKSHWNGRYPLGKDTREVQHGLHEWSRVSRTAQLMLEKISTLEYALPLHAEAPSP